MHPTVTAPVTVADSGISAVLGFGRNAIRVIFDSAELADRARGRLYLSSVGHAEIAGEIVYCRDDSVVNLIPQACEPNAVVIDQKVLGPARWVLNLKVFNEFCVSLTRDNNRVLVRYPASAHLTYLLDDVLQAAVQPFLEKVGGFILHGACLVKNGVGLALMGSSCSGKSTTAFNLVRAGYHCYADDAIIVTREDAELRAWPFSREMSIRPLSSQLLKGEGLSFSGYRQEGKKYYFRQPDVPENVGATLRYACLISVGGERATQVQRLTRDDFLDRLLRERRYFSFVNRDHHDRYAHTVADLVPEALSISLGHDLSAQVQSFDSVLDPAAPRAPMRPAAESNGRAAKLDQIRRAWAAPGDEPLADIIPMLAVSDLVVYKNALSFFQNFPLAHISPCVGWRPAPSEDRPSCELEAFSWLRFPEWEEGCRRLIEETCTETYDQHATGWFNSAPILYGFLRSQVVAGGAEAQALDAAWLRHRGARKPIGANAPMVILTDSDVPSEAIQTTDKGRPYTCISTRNAGKWRAAFERLISVGSIRSLAVVPLYSAVPADIGAVVECVRTAKSLGLEPHLGQWVPVCWFKEDHALSLLESGALADTGDVPTMAELSSIANVDWTDKVCNGLSACRLSVLGLCSGGYCRGAIR